MTDGDASDSVPSISDYTDLRNQNIFEFTESVSTTGTFPNLNSPGDGLVDVTITSPPYADLKDYGYDKAEQIGHDPYDTYLDDLREVFQAIYDVTKDTGTLWVVANSVKKDGRMLDLPFDIADLCQNLGDTPTCPDCSTDDIAVPLQMSNDYSGYYCVNCAHQRAAGTDSWILQDVVIWNKVRALPYSSKGRLRNVFEYILCFSKTDEFKFDTDAIRIADPGQFKEWWVSYPERYHPRGKLPDNIWEFVTPTQGWTDNAIDHPAPFPRGMVERILRLTTTQDDLVFDPFAGSGTVLAQAGAMKRRAIGYERSTEYCELYPRVQAHIEEEWVDRNGAGDSIATQQQQLEQIIGSLRQIKQLRECLRVHAKETDIAVGEIPVDGILHRSNEIRDYSQSSHQFIDSEITFLTTADANVDELHDTLSTVLTQSPCSKYGVEATVHVIPLDQYADAPETAGFPSEGYLYTDGHHNYTQGLVSQRQWSRLFAEHATSEQSGYPPIVSTLGLKVPDPQHVSVPRDGEDALVYELETVSTQPQSSAASDAPIRIYPQGAD